MSFMERKDGLVGALFHRIERAIVRRRQQQRPKPPRNRPTPWLEGLEVRIQFAGVGDEGTAGGSAAETDLLPDLIPWASKPNGYIYGWHLDRSGRTGKTLLRLTTAMANVGEGPMELRGGEATDKGQEVFQRIYTSDGEYRDRLAGVFRYHPTHNHTHFDNFAVYRLRYMTEADGVGRTVKAGNKVSFCLTDSDSYDLSLPGAPANGKYYSCGTRRQGISVGWSDIYDETLPEQWINVTGVPSGKYWLEVVVDPKNHILERDEKNNVARIPITLRDVSPPDNDDFSHAAVLTGSQVSDRGSNEQATRQDDEPRHAGGSGGASVWWTWTAPKSGPVSISTRGSEIDTLLAVYTGKSLHNLRLVEANDDARGDVTSRVAFAAKKGVTYHIAVDGYRGTTGEIRLGLRQDTSK